jgi:uncharacterized protein
VVRVLPTTEEASGFFWTGGADGKLRFLRCQSCAYFIHPPAPRCPHCLGADPAPTEVSGLGTVYSFTVNHQPWDGSSDVYVIAVVALDEQPDLRLTTNLVDPPGSMDPESARIGMRVEVVFEDHDPVFLPLFRPVGR